MSLEFAETLYLLIFPNFPNIDSLIKASSSEEEAIMSKGYSGHKVNMLFKKIQQLSSYHIPNSYIAII